jgi:hypothetical protein
VLLPRTSKGVVLPREVRAGEKAPGPGMRTPQARTPRGPGKTTEPAVITLGDTPRERIQRVLWSTHTSSTGPVRSGPGECPAHPPWTVHLLENPMNRFALSGMALLTALAACGGDAESREDRESQTLGDAVNAEAPRAAPAAQPARTAPAQPARMIQAGTLLTFEVRDNVSTSSHDVGSGFSLVLVDAVSGPAGAVLTAGAPARGVVTASHPSSGPEDQSVLGLRVASVEAYGAQRPLVGDVQSADVATSTRDSGTRTAATIATGTAAGAIIGQILGRDTRSTVTGAAIGTAVGVGVALTTRGGHAELPVGSRIVVRLSQDLIF